MIDGEKLAQLATGNEMLLLECLFYLSDHHGLDRIALADRLENTASNLAQHLGEVDKDFDTALQPMRRVAKALRLAIPIDEKGAPA